uniref:Uncharacterized protein n=1 Tax=Meloidogyne enterolobii TaxID=390850 RepID=A0A6V7U7Y0_MELEN|nr:unnamed protein product [Meloidogyne enterolobii]
MPLENDDCLMIPSVALTTTINSDGDSDLIIACKSDDTVSCNACCQFEPSKNNRLITIKCLWRRHCRQVSEKTTLTLTTPLLPFPGFYFLQF